MTPETYLIALYGQKKCPSVDFKRGRKYKNEKYNS